MREIIKEKGSVYCSDWAWQVLNKKINDLRPTKIFVLTDTNSQRYCLPIFLNRIKFEIDPKTLIIPEGENHKNIRTCETIWSELSAHGADRKSLLINLGGGVVTDLGGFVACTFMRGIEFINIPTTLLAMVDASIGGKNGVDLGFLKNQIGFIKAPLMVLINTRFLETLPPPQITSGLAEMMKHGLIFSENYWEMIQHFDMARKEEAESLIWQSVEIKNQIVSEDPFEINRRKTLNFGHTLGHAIESYFMQNSSKKNLLHGEAIAVGMILALFLSSEKLTFPKEKLKIITQAILKKFPKQSFDKNDIENILPLLSFDKKNRNGKVLFVLLYEIGEHKIDCEVSNELIFKAFTFYKNF